MHPKQPLQLVTGLLCKNSRNYIEEIFSAYQNGRVVVPLRSRDAASKMSGLQFESIVDTRDGGGWIHIPHQLSDSDAIAQISYTSGTEGEPKGIMLSHRNLADTIRRLISVMGLDKTVREYVGVPVYHSFGYGRIRACMAVGGHAYIPENSFNPIEIASMLRTGEINAISAVPTLWRLILDEPRVIGDLGARVRWIEVGSQYMAREEKEKLRQLFPNARIIQHYGLTEASRTTFLNISDTNGPALESVGKVSDGVEVQLGRQDVIEVRGDHVAKSKLTSAGIMPLIDQDGWFRTSDKGRIEEGYLYFLGRFDDVINCGGIKIAPDRLERAILESIDCTGGVAVCKVEDRIRGHGILITLERALEKHLDTIKLTVEAELAKLNLRAGESLHFDILDRLPTTDTGKIRRKEIGQSYDARNPVDNEPKPAELVDISDKDLREICQARLNVGPIDPSDSIIALGVDSLSLVHASLEVELYLGFLPDNWMGLTFQQLEQLKERSGNQTLVSSKRKPILLICFLMLFLVCGELALQIRSHLKTGRSALNLLTSQSTVVFNENLGVKTYRPGLVLRDPKTGKVQMSINKLGLRSPEIGQATADEIRIAVVGASTVAGAYANSNEETFPQILAQLIRTHANRMVNVINGGVEGLSLSGVAKITSGIVIPEKPEMVIVYTGFNDVTGFCNKASRRDIVQWRPPTFELPTWVMSQEMIRKNTTFLREQRLVGSNLIDPRNIDFSDHRETLEAMVSDIRSHGIEPILTTNARSYVNVDQEKQAGLAASSLYYYRCLNLQGIIEVGEMYNQMITEVARKQDVQLIDLGAVMPGGKEYFVDGGHFTFKGEKFVAQTIYDAIRNKFQD